MNWLMGRLVRWTVADLARAHVPQTAVLVSTRSGSYKDVFDVYNGAGASSDSPDRLVWAVTFDDQFEICPPNGDACWSPRPGQTQVILDYLTGEFLESASFAPQGSRCSCMDRPRRLACGAPRETHRATRGRRDTCAPWRATDSRRAGGERSWRYWRPGRNRVPWLGWRGLTACRDDADGFRRRVDSSALATL